MKKFFNSFWTVTKCQKESLNYYLDVKIEDV